MALTVAEVQLIKGNYDTAARVYYKTGGIMTPKELGITRPPGINTRDFLRH